MRNALIPLVFFPWELLGCPMGWGGESWRQLHGNPWYPVESDGIHEVMRLKPDQIQWNLLGFMRLWHPNLIKSNGIWLDSWDFKTQTLSIPVESDGFHQVLPIKSFQIQWNVMDSIRFWWRLKSNQIQFHEALPIKSYQIQWNLMGTMRLWQSNLTKSSEHLMSFIGLSQHEKWFSHG